MISLGTSTRSDPTVGEIHCLQISITELFNDESNFDSCVSDQSKSSSSSSSKSSGRRTKRPCVIWRTHPDLQVLVMSRFAGVDVSDPNVRLFKHLPQEYVLKKADCCLSKSSLWWKEIDHSGNTIISQANRNYEYKSHSDASVDQESEGLKIRALIFSHSWTWIHRWINFSTSRRRTCRTIENHSTIESSTTNRWKRNHRRTIEYVIVIFITDDAIPTDSQRIQKRWIHSNVVERW